MTVSTWEEHQGGQHDHDSFPDPNDVVITSMEGLMFSRVCLFVCRLVSRITRKLLNGFP